MLRDISLHLMDLMQNSISANANKLEVLIETIPKEDLLIISLKDNGVGMSPEFLENVIDPFTTSRKTRKVGMGIPFFKMACEIAEGKIHLQSIQGVGTTLDGTFKISSIDRLSLGDIGDTFFITILGNSSIEYNLILKNMEKQYIFNSKQIEEELDGIPIIDYEILQWIKDSINENVINIFGGVLNEIIS